MLFENLTSLQFSAALGAFAFALGMLQFLRVRRRRARVSSIRLWRQLAEREKPRVLWHRWKDLLSYACLLLMGSLLLIAIANPVRRGARKHRRTVVLVIDAGFSMRAREGNQRRIDLARAEAERVLADLNHDDRLAVVTARMDNRTTLPLSKYRREMRESLKNIEAECCNSDLRGAVNMARSIAGNDDRAEIILISDRTGPFASQVRGINVGKADSNAAITGVNIRQPTVLDPNATVTLTVTNDSEAALVCDLEIMLRETRGKIAVNQPPHSTREYVTVLPAPQGGKMTASLAFDEPLTEDNTIEAQLVRPSPIRVLLVGNPHSPVGRALSVDPELQVRTGGKGDDHDVIVRSSGEFGATAINAAFSTTSLTRPTLFASPRGAPLSPLRALSGVSIQAADTAHPITEGFEFKDIRIGNAVVFGAHNDSAAFQALAFAAGAPVLVAGQDPESKCRFIAAGWNLNDQTSGLTRQPQFIPFISRAVRWLARHPRERSVMAEVGENLTVDLQGSANANLTFPDGTSEDLGSVASIALRPRAIGVHRIDTSLRGTIYLNAIRQGEEGARVRPITARDTSGARPVHSLAPSIWVWCAFAALFILLAEWWAYLKRITV